MALESLSPQILQLGTFDRSGGAEKVAWNLFDGYRKRGFPSSLAVGRKVSGDPDVLEIPKEARSGRSVSLLNGFRDALKPWDGRIRGVGRLRNEARTLAGGIGLVLAKYGVENMDFPASHKILDLPQVRPNIVHAHNLHGGYFDLRYLPQLSHQVPVVITLHDAWLLSGHCAHSLGCERWRTGCGHCPDLNIYPGIRRDATAFNWGRKRRIFEKSRIYLAAPCEWLLERARDSILAPAIVDWRVIPNGLDLAVFKPDDQGSARAALGIPRDVKLLLFAANGGKNNPFKDYEMLRATLAKVAEQTPQDVWFIALGEDAPDEQIGRVQIRFVPHQGDERQVARYYQASDIYLHAAREDTFPNTVLEAMACACPVIATAVSGIPEQVIEGETGFLVPAGDAQAMANRVLLLLADEDRRFDMGKSSADRAARRFDLSKQIDNYLDWYREILFKSRL